MINFNCHNMIDNKLVGGEACLFRRSQMFGHTASNKRSCTILWNGYKGFLCMSFILDDI